MRDDLWEKSAGWWQDGFTAGADREYEEQILPLAAAHLSGTRRPARPRHRHGAGQVARLAAESRADFVGIDPTWAQVTEGVLIPFVHRPSSRYVNALTDNGPPLMRMEEPARPPGFLARTAEYSDAREIPCLLFMRTEKR